MYTHKSKQAISLDNVCTLMKRIYVQDEIGQDIPNNTATEVFCAEISVFASEYTKAGLQGIKPAVALIIQKSEYSGETILEYEGQRYVVYRTYQNEELIELYCEVRTGEYIH